LGECAHRAPAIIYCGHAAQAVEFAMRILAIVAMDTSVVLRASPFTYVRSISSRQARMPEKNCHDATARRRRVAMNEPGNRDNVKP
jgi:hypothetical protein